MSEQELRLLQRDAARYRFLRSPKSRDSKGCTRRALDVSIIDWAKKLDRYHLNNFWSRMDVAETHMDRAVDRAMLAARKETP